jgi:hypothetical protein
VKANAGPDDAGQRPDFTCGIALLAGAHHLFCFAIGLLHSDALAEIAFAEHFYPQNKKDG